MFQKRHTIRNQKQSCIIYCVFVEGWLQDNSFQLFQHLKYLQGLSLIFGQQSTECEEYTDLTKTLTYMYI